MLAICLPLPSLSLAFCRAAQRQPSIPKAADSDERQSRPRAPSCAWLTWASRRRWMLAPARRRTQKTEAVETGTELLLRVRDDLHSVRRTRVKREAGSVQKRDSKGYYEKVSKGNAAGGSNKRAGPNGSRLWCDMMVRERGWKQATRSFERSPRRLSTSRCGTAGSFLHRQIGRAHV